MSATNGIGYEVQIFIDKRVGWVMETNGYASLADAQAKVDSLPKTDFERRAYESLVGY